MSSFSWQQVKQIRSLLNRRPQHAGERSPEGFLLRYVFFEALIKTVGRYQRESVGRIKTTLKASKEALQIQLVQKWLDHFSIRVHPEKLKLILDSNLRRRGEKSARELRNGLVHQWDAADANEVMTRFDDLESALWTVIAAVENSCEKDKK